MSEKHQIGAVRVTPNEGASPRIRRKALDYLKWTARRHRLDWEKRESVQWIVHVAQPESPDPWDRFGTLGVKTHCPSRPGIRGWLWMVVARFQLWRLR